MPKKASFTPAFLMMYFDGFFLSLETIDSLKVGLYIIYLNFLFMAALGVHCFVRAFSNCGKRGLLFVAVQISLQWPLVLQSTSSVAPGLPELWVPGSRAQPQQLATQAWSLCCVWDLPRSGIKLVSLALQESLTTEPSGKSQSRCTFINESPQFIHTFLVLI